MGIEGICTDPDNYVELLGQEGIMRLITTGRRLRDHSVSYLLLQNAIVSLRLAPHCNRDRESVYTCKRRYDRTMASLSIP
jgi:hypothetical protein